jgi:hypothetical protein
VVLLNANKTEALLESQPRTAVRECRVLCELRAPSCWRMASSTTWDRCWHDHRSHWNNINEEDVVR